MRPYLPAFHLKWMKILSIDVSCDWHFKIYVTQQVLKGVLAGILCFLWELSQSENLDWKCTQRIVIILKYNSFTVGATIIRTARVFPCKQVM